MQGCQEAYAIPTAIPHVLQKQGDETDGCAPRTRINP